MAVICPEGHSDVQALADKAHCFECGVTFDPAAPLERKKKK